MNYVITDDLMGAQPIAQSSTTQRHQLGQIVHAIDADGGQGGAEFIYLPGLAGTTPGTLVFYDPVNRTTALATGANTGRAVAVSMSANIAGQFGWYAMYGAVNINKDGTALTAGGTVGIGTVAGTCGASAAGLQLLGATALNAAATGATQAMVAINRTDAQGRIT